MLQCTELGIHVEMANMYSKYNMPSHYLDRIRWVE